MPWLEGRIHEAGEVEKTIQRCRRCGKELGGLPAMLPPGMSPDEALAIEWDAFEPGALIKEVPLESSPPGTIQTRLEQVPDLDVALGAARFCDDDSPWPASDEPS